ncbi:hypothetical protein GC173_04225 [bacterium]|nr:hypothetical protein [bacterium]
MEQLTKRRIGKIVGWSLLIGTAPVVYTLAFLLGPGNGSSAALAEKLVPVAEVARTTDNPPDAYAALIDTVPVALDTPGLWKAEWSGFTPFEVATLQHLIGEGDSPAELAPFGSPEALALAYKMGPILDSVLADWEAQIGKGYYYPLPVADAEGAKTRRSSGSDKNLSEQFPTGLAGAQLPGLNRVAGHSRRLLGFMAEAKAAAGDWPGATADLRRLLRLREPLALVDQPRLRADGARRDDDAAFIRSLIRLEPDEAATAALLDVVTEKLERPLPPLELRTTTRALAEIARNTASYESWGMTVPVQRDSMIAATNELISRPALLQSGDSERLLQRVLPRTTGYTGATGWVAAARQLMAVVDRSPNALGQLGYPEEVIRKVNRREAVLLVAAHGLDTQPLAEELAETRLWLVRAALATRLHFLRNGEWPESLEELPKDLWPGLPAGSELPMAERRERRGSTARALPLGPFELARRDPTLYRWNGNYTQSYPATAIVALVADTLENTNIAWKQQGLGIGSVSIISEDETEVRYQIAYTPLQRASGGPRDMLVPQACALAETIRGLAGVDHVRLVFTGTTMGRIAPMEPRLTQRHTVDLDSTEWQQDRKFLFARGDRFSCYIEIIGHVPKTPLVLRSISADIRYDVPDYWGTAGDVILLPEIGG